MLDLRNINPLIKQIAEEKDLPAEKVFEALENALAAAYKKEYGNKNQIIKCKINPETGEVQFFRVFWVVDKDNLKEDEEEQLDKSAEQKSGTPPSRPQDAPETAGTIGVCVHQ